MVPYHGLGQRIFVFKRCANDPLGASRLELIILHLPNLDFNQLVCLNITRERFNQRGNHSGSRKPTPESSSSVQIQFAMDTEDSGYTCSTDQLTRDNNQYQGTVSPRDSESTPTRTNSPCSRSNDTQEASHSIDGSWDEQNVWMSNIDWQRPADSSLSNGWQGEATVEELESYPQQNASSWIDEGPTNSWRQWRVRRRPPCHDLFQNFSDNAEIRDLLERYILIPFC